MKHKTQKKISLAPVKRFSESIKRKVVKDIETGSATVIQVSRELNASQ